VGNITIGNNVTISANSFICKNIPNNAVIIGNPAKIIKLNNQKVNIPL
jgi:serine acetyltransferase